MISAELTILFIVGAILWGVAATFLVFLGIFHILRLLLWWVFPSFRPKSSEQTKKETIEKYLRKNGHKFYSTQKTRKHIQ